MAPGFCIPEGGLDQGMLNNDACILPSHIFEAPGVDDCPDPGDAKITQAISEALILRALRTAYTDATIVALEGRNSRQICQSKLCLMPEIDVIDIDAERVHTTVPLFPIQLDESTTKNNVEILRNIHITQCRFPLSFFGPQIRPLLLVAGDNKTMQRIWKIIGTSGSNDEDYEKMRHIVVVPGLFHTLMNYCRGVVGVYWLDGNKRAGGPKTGSMRDILNRSTLQFTGTILGRKFVSPESTQLFTHQRSFIVDNYEGRVLALLYQKLGINHRLKRDDIALQIAACSRRELLQAIAQVAIDIRAGEKEHDLERQAHMHFLRDAEVLLVMRHAVKYGDIGLIMRCVNQMVIFFHGTNRWAYAHEMLYLKRISDTGFANPIARRAILAGMLVNPTGKLDGFYPIDLANEYLNKSIKDTWAIRHSSASNMESVTEYATVNGIYLEPLAKGITAMYAQAGFGLHPPATRSRELCHIARLISSSIWKTPAPPLGTLTPAQERVNEKKKKRKAKAGPNAAIIDYLINGAQSEPASPILPEPLPTRDQWIPPPDVYVLGALKLISPGGKIEKFNQKCLESVYERLRDGDDEQDEENNDAGNEEDVGTGLDLEGPETVDEWDRERVNW
jgi:hypothetical protein